MQVKKEISGLKDHEFEKTYSRTSDILINVMKHEGERRDRFLEHFAEEIDHWIKEAGGKLSA